MHASPGEHLRRIALVVAVAACRAGGDTPPADTPRAAPVAAARFDSTMVTILDSLRAGEIASQCSRPSPGPVTAYWVPTREQVAEADAAVLRALAAVPAEGPRAPGDTATLGARAYYRQYAGLVRGDARILYVNGLARETVVAQRDTAAWRTIGQVACDGGASFFGAEYDPATRRVSALHFNGPG